MIPDCVLYACIETLHKQDLYLHRRRMVRVAYSCQLYSECLPCECGRSEYLPAYLQYSSGIIVL